MRFIRVSSMKMAWIVFSVVCTLSVSAFGQPWDGSGTEGDPYLIYTPVEMNTIGAMLLDYDKHFRLMANIDLSAYTGTSFFIIGIYPDYPFTGVFDGNGHKISNFSYTSTATDYIGVFGYIDGASAEIKDLGLVNYHRASSVASEPNKFGLSFATIGLRCSFIYCRIISSVVS